MNAGSIRTIRRVQQDSFLGPAVVVAVHDGTAVTVALAHGKEVRAELALPYEPVLGDVLLVIGHDEHYVIGVLSGRGKHSMALQGDVSVRAIGGTLDLAGDAGVRIRGPEIEVHAGTLRTVARTVIDVFTTLHQRVSDILSVHAGQSHTIVDEGAYTQAKTAAIQTEETVTINGKQIHLG